MFRNKLNDIMIVVVSTIAGITVGLTIAEMIVKVCR